MASLLPRVSEQGRCIVLAWRAGLVNVLSETCLEGIKQPVFADPKVFIPRTKLVNSQELGTELLRASQFCQLGGVGLPPLPSYNLREVSTTEIIN